MVNPKNLKTSVMDILLNQGYDVEEITKMSWEKVNKIVKEAKEDGI